VHITCGRFRCHVFINNLLFFDNLPKIIDYYLRETGYSRKIASMILRVRFSLLNLDLSGGLLNIPLFMADQTKRLIDIAIREKNDDILQRMKKSR